MPSDWKLSKDLTSTRAAVDWLTVLCSAARISLVSTTGGRRHVYREYLEPHGTMETMDFAVKFEVF